MKKFINIIIIISGKQVQYPSLEKLQHDLSRFRLKPTVNNNVNHDLTNIKSKLEHIDNYSSDEEIDVQKYSQTSVERRPIFDRSTKVL